MSDTQRQIEKTYNYLDPEGDLLFQVVRFKPKAFAQRRPDGKGGWIWNLDGIESRPLYRIHEIMKAPPSQPVVIVEGEKDVDALWDLGLLATCNPGGAGKWRLADGAMLRGRRVAVIPDCDEPGQAHALDVMAKLLWWEADIPSVRYCILPGISEGGDVSSWLTKSNHHLKTREERRKALCEVIRKSTEWKCTQGTQLLAS